MCGYTLYVLYRVCVWWLCLLSLEGATTLSLCGLHSTRPAEFSATLLALTSEPFKVDGECVFTFCNDIQTLHVYKSCREGPNTPAKLSHQQSP